MSLRAVVGTALGRKGLGWTQDPDDARDALLGLLGLSETPLDSVLYEKYVPQRLNQGGTESCVGQSWAEGLQLDQLLDGNPRAPLPSAQAIWTWARLIDGGKLTNRGTHLRSGAKAIMLHGIPPEKSWPFNPRTINKTVPWGAYRAGHDARGPQGYYRIPYGDLDGMRRALSSKRPVVFGLQVRRSFLDNRGPSTVDVDTKSPIAGYHAMLAIGYDRDRVRVLNHWGPKWRDNGCVWLTNALMRQAFGWVADFRQPLRRRP